MNRMIRITIITTLLIIMHIMVSADEQMNITPIAKVEHFYAYASKAQELYMFLHTELQLPVVWEFTDYGSFASGGLSLGNVVFEIVRQEGMDNSKIKEATIHGIAFEPYGSASSAVILLDKMSVGHTTPEPFKVQYDGAERVAWETFTLDVLPKAAIFVCDYKARAYVKEGRENGRRELLSSNGGPLGIRGLREIVIALADLQKGIDSWANLLGDEKHVAPGLFQFTEGPSIRLVQNSHDEIRELVLEVDSLNKAKLYLQSRGQLGPMYNGKYTIAPSVIHGLTISLIQNNEIKY